MELATPNAQRSTLNVQLLSKNHLLPTHELDGTRFGVPPSGGDRVNTELQTYPDCLRAFEPLTSVLSPSEEERGKSSSFTNFKSKTVRALPPARGLAGRFAHLSGTRVFAQLTIAGHRCSFGFQ